MTKRGFFNSRLSGDDNRKEGDDNERGDGKTKKVMTAGSVMKKACGLTVRTVGIAASFAVEKSGW